MFFSVSLSEIISTFEILFLFKNVLKIFVFLISFLTSSKINNSLLNFSEMLEKELDFNRTPEGWSK